MSKIFNISASNCFVETLAQHLLERYKDNPLALADVLIFLPNRRACRSLAEAFVRLKGLSPTLLPQMRPIGDIKEDELLLSGESSAETFAHLPPVIDPQERLMLFIKLIISRPQDFGLEKISLSQACFLAQELGSLIDSADLQELSWDNLNHLVPEEYASHWQETLKFLGIITKYWPAILEERGVIDAGKRKNLLIKTQTNLWKQTPPEAHIIVAGSTAVSPTMKAFIKTVLSLPKGEVYLAGLDKILDEKSWELIDETHPQFELKQLLDFLKITREEIPNLCAPKNIEREKFISEILRPASCSDQWRSLKGKMASDAFEGIKIIEAKDSRLEALSIAVLIRKALETPEKTIALVTPDRTLARRTTEELHRWQIEIDDSAGIPLAQTLWGIFMRELISATMPQAAKADILAFLKNKLFAFKLPTGKAKKLAERLDKLVWRQHLTDKEAETFLQEFLQKICKFQALFNCPEVSLEELIKQHIALAEELSTTDICSGEQVLWQNEDGQTGAEFLANVLAKAPILGRICPTDYASLFEALMSSIMVHSSKASHPRIKILGPMEARLNHYDEIILGGFNEGTWPLLPSADPWMSRPMKKDFGFDLPERQIGVLGLDFANLLGAEKIYLTRAQTTSGTPSLKSRWHMRMETVLAALGISPDSLIEKDIPLWAEELDTPQKFITIEAPAPTPPIEARPRRLSASAVEKLMRDPYSIFAEYILKLKPLDDLDQPSLPADFGNIVHKVLEEFNQKYSQTLPENAEELLLLEGIRALESAKIEPEKKVFWKPKLEEMLRWIVAEEKNYRQTVKKVHNEIWGQFFIEDAPAGRFEIFAKADRVDELIDGSINIIDYKTGQARRVSEIEKGYAPQLPIEGLIAEKGGFNSVEKAPVSTLMYWKLGKEVISVDTQKTKILEQTEEHLKKLINLFDFVSTGYLSRPNPKHLPEYSDYEHLARVKEWSVLGDEGEQE